MSCNCDKFVEIRVVELSLTFLMTPKTCPSNIGSLIYRGKIPKNDSSQSFGSTDFDISLGMSRNRNQFVELKVVVLPLMFPRLLKHVILTSVARAIT